MSLLDRSIVFIDNNDSRTTIVLTQHRGKRFEGRNIVSAVCCTGNDALIGSLFEIIAGRACSKVRMTHIFFGNQTGEVSVGLFPSITLYILKGQKNDRVFPR